MSAILKALQNRKMEVELKSEVVELGLSQDVKSLSKIVSKEWDAGSKATISDNPEIISIINTHMGNGVFDKVNEVLQQEKTLGKLAGVSDVQAYHNIAEYMASKGMLTPGNSQATAPTVSTETEDQTQANAERNKKRKAAASVKQTKTETKNQETDFLGLSDDEFMKKFASR